MAGGFELSATTVKNWFQYRCDRKTRYEIMADADRKAIPVAEQQKQRAWSDLGNNYELLVVESLGQDVLRPVDSKAPLSENMTIAFLQGKRPESYAAQINMRPNSESDLVKNTGLKIRRTMADLVRIERDGQKQKFTVIDIKATRHATAFHKAQVAFYVEMLRTRLADLGVAAILSDTGEIWRISDNGTASGSEYQIEEFALAPYIRMVREFCQTTLPRIAEAAVEPKRDSTFFHIYFKCEQCDFLPHCQHAIDGNKGIANSDVSAVAGLSHEAKRALHRNGIRTVEQFAAAEGIGKRDGVGWSLQRSARQLVERAKALLEDKILRSEEEHSCLMPPRVEATLLLSVDHDPVDDMIAAIGYEFRLGDENRRNILVLPTSDRRSEADALSSIFTELLGDLHRIDAHNAAAEENEEETINAHIFLFEPAEARNLQSAIARHLDDPRIRGGLLDIVRLFPPDDVVPEPEFRGAHHLPATAVRSVVEQLYAMPVRVSYDLRQVSNALARQKMVSSAYSPELAFERPFSSLLSIDIIRGIKDGQAGTPDANAIECDVAARLDALKAIIDWLFDEDEAARKTGKPLLRLNKKPFRLHATFDPLNMVDLDVLLALELLESRAGLLDCLIGLAQPVTRRRDARRCIAGMKISKISEVGKGALRFKIIEFDVPQDSRESDFQPGGFGLILTDDDPDVRLDRSAWTECKIDLLKSRPGRPNRWLSVKIHLGTYNSPGFQAMMSRSAGAASWCIDQSFTDMNSERAAHFLSTLVDDDRP